MEVKQQKKPIYILTLTRLNKLLLYFAAIMMLLKMFSRFYNGSWEYAYGNSYTFVFSIDGLYRYGSIFATYALIIFFVANVHCILKRKDFIAVVLCVLPFITWTLIECMRGNSSKVLTGSMPTLFCLVPLFYLYANAKGVRESLKNISLLLCVGYLVIAVYSSIDFYLIVGYGRSVLSSPAKDSLSFAIISLWVYLFCDPTLRKTQRDRRVYVFKLILIFVALVCSLAIVSRSWTIQCIILLIGFILVSSESKELARNVGKIAVITVVLCLIIFFGFEELLEALLGRMDEDTRTGQYEQFFSQVSISDLIIGQGMDATYIFNGVEYHAFDNQLIFSGFHYGILYFVSLVLFLIRTLMYKSKEKIDIVNKIRLRGMKLVTILYILAMGGLSVYFKYDWSISMAILLLFIGDYKNRVQGYEDEYKTTNQ